VNSLIGECMWPDKFKLKNFHEPYGRPVRFGTASARIGAVMIRGAWIALLAVSTVCSPLNAQSNVAMDRRQEQQPKTDPEPKSGVKGQVASLTGCVDEQEGKWVLVNDQTMAVIADLAADGFPKEAFAKHMGHKVTVRGTRSSEGQRPVFKVRSIETISDTCTAR